MTDLYVQEYDVREMWWSRMNPGVDYGRGVGCYSLSIISLHNPPHPCSDKPLLLILIKMGLIFQRAKSLYHTSFMIYMEYLPNIKADKLAWQMLKISLDIN